MWEEQCGSQRLTHDYVQVNITLCAAISVQGVMNQRSILGPYNTAFIICFLETLHDTVVQDRPEQPQIVVIWDNVSIGLLWSETGSPTIIDLQFLPIAWTL